MLRNGLPRSRALQTAWKTRSNKSLVKERYFSTIGSTAQFDQKTPAAINTASSRKVPLARHSDLLATAGSEDDVTGLELKIAGLVRSIRKQKKVAFAHVSDGSTLQPVQAILTPEQAKDITNGSYVELVGTWASSPAQGQANELQVTAVDRVGETIPDDFPIQKKSMGADFLRTVPHLRFRTPLHGLIARARSRLVRDTNHYYNVVRLNEIHQVHPPLITSSDCEGAGEVFTISPKNSTPSPASNPASSQEENKLYFRTPKYLTVSSQLHLEAYSAELGDVWTLSPTFRAEESDTPRHLSEFYMLEAEFRSITSLSELTREVEDLIRYLVTSFRKGAIGKEVLSYYADPKYQTSENEHDNNQNQIKTAADLEERWLRIDSRPWTSMTYTDAIHALETQTSTNFTFAPTWKSGLQLEHERWLVQNVGGNSPVFITNYPKHIKPFYMLPSNAVTGQSQQNNKNTTSDNEDTVACFDLLFPFGTAELVGGSLREHRLANLITTMREKGLIRRDSTATATQYPYLEPGESFGSMQWYADLRRFGSSPHGGFGMGFDRLLAYLTGMANVRDTVGFPRWFGRADC